MPPVLTDGLKIASGILPAVGMAMLLKMMNFKNTGRSSRWALYFLFIWD